MAGRLAPERCNIGSNCTKDGKNGVIPTFDKIVCAAALWQNIVDTAQRGAAFKKWDGARPRGSNAAMFGP